MKAKLVLPALLLMSLGTVGTHAQSGGQYDLRWSTVDSGGATSSGGKFTVSGTVGQPDAGKLAGGNFTIEGGFWSGVSVIQVPGAPVLKIKLVGTNAVISWPKGVTGFSLEERPSIGGGTWNATPQSILDTASEHTVSVPASGVMKIFRLKK
jgi:hypothetical protein